MNNRNVKYFVSLDENGVVVNCVAIDYSHSLIEYSKDQSITNNEPLLGSIYNKEQNSFIHVEE